MVQRHTIGDKLFNIFLYVFMVMMAAITLYPFLNVLAISLNDSVDAVRGGIHIWPRKFTLQNYREVFTYPHLVTGFYISVLRTVSRYSLGPGQLGNGCICNQLSGVHVPQVCVGIFVLTLLFRRHDSRVHAHPQAGPNQQFLGIHFAGPYQRLNVFVLRAYMDTLPENIKESAKLDGANDLTIFFRLILPLCKPVLATIALFIAVGQWNSWFDTFLYTTGNPSLTTLQYEMMRILQNVTVSSTGSMYALGQANAPRVSPESIRMTITVVATVPIVLVYPFLQKYFVKGLTLGALKG